MDKTATALPLLALTLLLAACGNKGPLVRAPDEPPPVPVEPAAPVEGTLPDTTPPEQPPATEALPEPGDTGDGVTVPPPPEAADGG
jgi:hypothetical protein